ncbi:MAG: hypothetical protein SPK52_02150 [Synergistales bacterium]|nr:hypothetical protein [Bacteroidales bacterium]MDY6434999.1 hypothetical protein [Synergistales bacterium]
MIRIILTILAGVIGFLGFLGLIIWFCQDMHSFFKKNESYSDDWPWNIFH